MPYPRKQAIAVLLSARRRGDKKTAAKAKSSLRGKSGGKGGRKR